ncbi:ferrochelatase [Vibrio mediterranei]|jgi:ferrochelatase|uniref:Ferrochelatase n=1 Tax=Vibrio mediterranei TaxID=689 RepID=A0ABX5DAQ6_9VIBR|nr:ferrochelatase [Vibrio mediterranei]MCG9626802.1 ferrochelatase [Vibrio mediterranei]MCG9662448.1 ferrochelatase [Vibrio mediterranei]PCD87144.1 ferrochelatase [Vibrio mediterranei]PRQ65957.1 ferrochelatase [Vibrio mediterranei]PTC02492.1 ferrochelatase [Vibrio mediterranei]
MSGSLKTGVLLVNLGTPDEPTAKGVKAFLQEFLHDHRVVDMNRWLWCPILHGVILPIRSPKVAKLYQSVWMEQGSPLMVYSRQQADKLAQALDMPVELGMSYGNPSLKDGLSRLLDQGVDKVVVLPLYPQYSGTTTAAAFDGIAKACKSISTLPSISLVRDYHDNARYIKALANSVRAHWEQHGRADYLLCSYHGIPKRYADNGDVYPLHCEATTKLLGEELGLDSSQIGMSYQSIFGREEWLQPYTEQTLKQMPDKGIKSLDIITPAFSVDCLETLEEIAVEAKETFIEAGGESYRYISCLNDSQEHIDMMVELVQSA